MENKWNDDDASNYKTDLALRVYSSRLLGQDSRLVLHGGGNTSVKISEKNIVGEDQTILYVKGSGWDLEIIEEAGFSPVQLDYMVKLSRLNQLSDPQMVNELKTHMTDASAPGPSVETILHALLPYKYVDHTHADSVVTITNTNNGLEKIKSIYQDKVIVIPYVMPGFDLAKKCAEIYATEAHDGTIGMVLMNHGIFSFGETAKQAYDRMIDLVNQAEEFLKDNNAWELNQSNDAVDIPVDVSSLVKLRKDISAIVGQPMIVSTQMTEKTLKFSNHPQIDVISQQGPATPDHVIRTKRIPMLGNDVPGYATAYQQYFSNNAKNTEQKLTILDSAPRIVLDKKFGLITVGKSIKDANICADIYDHTMDIQLRGTQLGGYKALPPSDIFEVEYWDLEQAKLKKSGNAPEFLGEVAWVTGAASGIGKACVEALLAKGACVVGSDIDEKVLNVSQQASYLAVVGDVTDSSHIESVIKQVTLKFGGLDMLVLNAGIFPNSCKISDLGLDSWRQVFDINLDANLNILKNAFPLLKLAPNTGRVVVIGSKNVPAPGPGASAYSASKAALQQLTRIASLEWGNDQIRLNTLHPNAVFDTGIWTEEVLNNRAKHYGLSVEEYKTNNILKTEVTSKDVADLAMQLCGSSFAKTTGAQVPIDGGNERVI
ncbi:MAG: bifunctional aldolase/short-chain dehydrogenase [Methylococcales bacterium]|jgi:rhamnose utilization protein RhaD (predicted bifunctional aldolase and dehydrogenase)/NAD(P)-dependent dehydrogenase (short-subunit alcohol dehydrogenase family)|nr:bifunctional aldolase/short-chain dehydrogenase [Methylococcales bacterium]MBT7408557.1 bifunctional aldolase/short-chain dehydrogenase [Methylococcales bacterium]